MDELMYANIEKAKIIMGNFPKEVPKEDQNRADYDDLAALYKAKTQQVTLYGKYAPVFQEQLDHLTAHVASCVKIWDKVRVDMVSKNHTIKELYCLGMQGHELPGGSRTVNNQSPVKRRAARPGNSARMANMRELVKLWHEELGHEAVSALCVDANEVRRLKISCSATMSTFIPKQIFP